MHSVFSFSCTLNNQDKHSLFTQKWKITDFSLSLTSALSRFPTLVKSATIFRRSLHAMQLCSEVFPARKLSAAVLVALFHSCESFPFHVMMFSGVRCNKNGNFCVARRQRKVFRTVDECNVGAEAAAAASFPASTQLSKVDGKAF